MNANTSQLWQRLRAARKFADLTQAQMGEALGFSRAAYAFWEGSKPGVRSHPSAEKVMRVAEITKVPVAWLMSNESVPDDVWKVASRPTAAAPAPVPAPAQDLPPPPPPPTSPPPSGVLRITDRLSESFWRGVEFQVVSARESLQDAFQVEMRVGPLTMTADFCTPVSIVTFASGDLAQNLEGHVAKLLLRERAAGRALNKYLLYWQQGFARAAGESILDVQVVPVASAEQACSFLLQLP